MPIMWILYKLLTSSYLQNKKVLLRERKRHTARRVVSTPSVVLPGYPPGGGTWPGYPPQGGYLTRVPPRGGTWPGYPPGGVPDPGNPPGGVPDPGTPPGGVPGPPLPPPGVDRQTKWNYYLPVVLRTRAVITGKWYYGPVQWFPSHWGSPRKNMGPVEVLWDGDGVPPGCQQTENITSRHTWIFMKCI